jgi:uncharacterized phage protein (TIGR02218 family)
VKTVSGSLLAHMAAGTTTLAWCWKVTRTDGEIFGFTSVDRNLIFDGQLYMAATGFTPSAIEGQIDLAVPNLELVGLLDSESITEADLIAGKWDGASVEIFQVNYADLTQGKMDLRVGTIGNVSSGSTGFRAEGRGLAQALQQPVGEVYAPACSANLGDARCQVDLGPLTETGAVTTATSRRAFSDSSRAEAADYWGAGVVEWLTGANAGLRMEVASFTGGAFELHLAMPYTIAVGDTYSVVPGCRKRRTEDCGTKFSNVVNFRGFPDVPLNDKIIGVATAASVE